ncbi:MAG: 30S ribosomal protein S8 [Bacteroidetes bacterium]|nr:30S ribosomal protein S8 [Bacteroidota bacterium]
MHTDPIADLLTRIRNGQKARHRVVEIPGSQIKLGIVKVLHRMGYIANYKWEDNEKQGLIKVALKYDPITKKPAITKLDRVSSPGLRQYANTSEIPRVLNGLGIAILTTSKGILTGKEAKAQNVGGEVLCYVY